MSELCACPDCYPKCATKILDKSISLINIILFTVMIILLVLVILIIIQTVFHEGMNIRLSREGIYNFLTFWTDYKILLVTLFSVTTLFVASSQFKRYLAEYEKRGNIEETKAVIEIRKLLDQDSDNFNIHTELEHGVYEFPEKLNGKTPDQLTEEEEEKSDEFKNFIKARAECFRYLGTIELASVMVRKGIITTRQFKNQFGYRVDNVVECVSLWKYLNGEEKKYWNDLHWIIKEMNCVNTK